MSDAIGEGIFTQEQMDYVKSIEDKDLRAHLLHQTRLRDNLRGDRDAFEKQANEWPTIAKAVERLITELNADKSEGSYYYSWQANIAMAFKDAYNKYWENNAVDISEGCDVTIGDLQLHEISNKAAKNFLDSLCHIPENIVV